MDWMNYGEIRWKIIFGSYDGCEEVAVNALYSILQRYLPYPVTVYQAAEPADGYAADHLILIGTLANNHWLKKFADAGIFKPETHKEGYSLKVGSSPLNTARKMVIIQGVDPAGVLYGVRDFEHFYEQNVLKYHIKHCEKPHRPFIDDPLDYERSTWPQIENRGLWSWGHMIHDYTGYIDHMSRWKMNTLVIWNDFVPLNARMIVEYAHQRAVKIYWGYSWCWGENVNPKDDQDLEYWAQRVLATFESQYLSLQPDGIYMQLFTETSTYTIEGELIASLAAKWVNQISAVILDKYPDLKIQFGIHATSVGPHSQELAGVDTRIAIIWEDCGGFPFNYDPREVQDPDQLGKYCRELLSIRGAGERFGMLFKGMTVLDWIQFEHYKHTTIVGEAERTFLDQRTRDKNFFWKFNMPYWLTQIGQLQQTIQLVAEADIAEKIIMALVEDGMWESEAYVPVVLLAELLWNPAADLRELIIAVMHCWDCAAL